MIFCFISDIADIAEFTYINNLMNKTTYKNIFGYY